jgi:aerobic-type carbon monoxide dehydrogenase small subunit (CoxS/CutS family)
MPDSREPDAHARARKIRVHCEINGRATTLETYPMARLLDVLREQPGLTGTKEGCGEGECGACSVLIDGELVNSCLVPILQVDGASIVTIEASHQPTNSTPSNKPSSTTEEPNAASAPPA